MHETDNNKGLTRQARFHASRMKKALEPLRSVHRTISLQLAFTFLHVAYDEGLTVSALATRCNVSNTVMSRHLRDLGNINRHRKTGLELVAVTQRVYGDRRERHVILTARGANVARQMIAALHPAMPTRVPPKSPPETDAPGA